MNVIDYIYENHESFTPEDWTQWTAALFSEFSSDFGRDNQISCALDFADKWDTKEIAKIDWPRMFCQLPYYHQLFSTFSDCIDWDVVSHTKRWYMSTMNEILPYLDEFADRLDLNYLEIEHGGIPRDLAFKYIEKFDMKTILKQYRLYMDDYVKFQDRIDWNDPLTYSKMPRLYPKYFFELKRKINVNLLLEHGRPMPKVLNAVKKYADKNLFTKAVEQMCSSEEMIKLAPYLDFDAFRYGSTLKKLTNSCAQYFTDETWKTLSKTTLPIEFIREHEDKLHIDLLLWNNKLPMDIIIRHMDEINWSNSSYYLTESVEAFENPLEFFEKYFDVIGPHFISFRKGLTDEFILKHSDKLELDSAVSFNGKLSFDTLMKLKDKISSRTWVNHYSMSLPYLDDNIDTLTPRDIAAVAKRYNLKCFKNAEKLLAKLEESVPYVKTNELYRLLNNDYPLTENFMIEVLTNDEPLSNFQYGYDDSEIREFQKAIGEKIASGQFVLSEKFELAFHNCFHVDTSKLTDEVVEPYVNTANSSWMCHIAENANISHEFIKKHEDKFDEKSWRVMARNPHITAETVLEYFDKMHQYALFWKKPSIMAEIIDKVVDKLDEEGIESYVAYSPNVDDKILLKYQEYIKNSELVCLSQRHRIPDEILISRMKTMQPKEMKSIIKNQPVPKEFRAYAERNDMER